MRPLLFSAVASLGLVAVAAGPALADEDPSGMTVTVAPGVDVFTSEEMLDYSDLGPAWGARVAFRTRRVLGLELGYTGMAREVTLVGLEPDTRLMGHGAEALVRLQLGNPDGIEAYLLGGAGWRRYQLTGQESYDHVLELPAGVGLMLRFGSLVIDARTTYRRALDDELVAGPMSETVDPDLDHVEGSLAIGAEF